MHLTPEQIDRHPFRMTRRGYDIVQVRDFLREIATEMRERQQVRERLAEADDEAQVHEGEILARAQAQAAEIIAAAQRDADELANDAETRALDRSDVVLSEAQARLDQLLAEERELKARLGPTPGSAAPAMIGGSARDTQGTVDARDRGAPANGPDTALAEFMKSTLRHEANPD